MGLDGVELVMATEEHFAIKIEDGEAERVTTPAQLIDLVLRKLQSAPRMTCRSQRAFHIARRYITEKLSIPRAKIRLETKLSELGDLERQRNFWLGLKANLKRRPGLNWNIRLRFEKLLQF